MTEWHCWAVVAKDTLLKVCVNHWDEIAHFSATQECEHHIALGHDAKVVKVTVKPQEAPT